MVGCSIASSNAPEPGWQTESYFTISLAGTIVYTSASNLTDSNGWTLAHSHLVTVPSSSVPLIITVTSLTNNDHTILFDSITVSQSTTSTLLASSVSDPRQLREPVRRERLAVHSRDNLGSALDLDIESRRHCWKWLTLGSV